MIRIVLLLAAMTLAAAFPAAGQGASGQEAAAGQEHDQAAGRQAPDQRMLSVWDLKLGAHAREMSTADYIDFACGTNGGPPSRVLDGWMGYAQCRPEAGSGLHEVYYRFDDEAEYIGRARNLELQIQRFQYTNINGLPVIASALFDDDGFYVGLRAVTDPRAPLDERDRGVTLGGHIMAFLGDDGWTCVDQEPRPGESPYQGSYIRRHCSKEDVRDGLRVRFEMEQHNFRREGQAAIDPRENTPTQGQFESTTRFEEFLVEPIPDRAAKLAAIEALGPVPLDPVVERARDCAGCDLTGANLKRADLRGANLAGADLTGANLHAAILTGANLAGANLTDANINRANLKQADLENAVLKGAMLYGAAFDGARLMGADLTGALAGKAAFVRADLTGARLFAVDLREARLNDANFSKVDFTRSWLHDAQLTRTNLSGALLVYVTAHRANLAGANLSGADARGSDFFGANMRDADLTDADFSYTRLLSVNLSAARLTGTRFEETELPAGFTPPTGRGD